MALAARPARPVHPSARAFRLFAARRRAAAVEGRRRRRSRIARRRSPSPTPTICSARWNLPRRRSKEGVQPIIGCQLDFSFPRRARGKLARHRAAPGARAVPAGADRRQRGRLPQSGPAGQPRLSRNAARRRPCICRSRSLDGLADGIICLTGGPRGPIGTRAEERSPAARRRAPAGAEATCSATGSMSSSSGWPATTARSRPRRSISPTGTICRWSPPTRRSSRRATISRRMTR